jgi:hypothetical protein
MPLGSNTAYVTHTSLHDGMRRVAGISAREGGIWPSEGLNDRNKSEQMEQLSKIVISTNGFVVRECVVCAFT